jgi:hypothetical protein
VRLRFADGAEGEIDLAPFLYGPVFQPLKDPDYFAGFEIDDTLVWPNGADFAPEFLREQLDERTSDEAANGSLFAGPWKEPPPDDPPLPNEVCRFCGIIVSMGVPGVKSSTLTIETEHDRAKIDVESWAVEGRLPKYELECLDEWRAGHLEDLRRNVARLERGEEALPIEPLD